MKRISEALTAMMPAFRPVGVERVSLMEAPGRVLTEPVLARSDLPAFDNSAMDGFALRTEQAPGPLRIEGESRAGGPVPGPLAPGAAMRIYTGAPVPHGADAVVPVEQTEVDGEQVRCTGPVRSGQHIRFQGSDLPSGAPMVRPGRALGPGEVAILAAQGVGAVTVHRRPRVAILSTGDELRDLTDPVRPGSIVNSNAYSLAAQVREAGGEAWVLPNAPDRLDALTEGLDQALSADVVVTSGGVSVGDHDHVKSAFEQVGVKADFWKVQLKPGKPLTFGKRGSVPVVGLPGNPVSAFVTFEVFVRPGLRAMQGLSGPYRPVHALPLAEPLRHKPGRPELVRARIDPRGEGRKVWPLKNQGSGALPSMVEVDALVLLSAEREHFEAGERLPCLCLDDRGDASAAPFDA